MLNNGNSIQASEIPDNNPPLNQPSNNKTMYYCYDKNGNYTGFIYSDSQPTDSTTKAPVKPYKDESGNPVDGITVGMTKPKWNGTDWIEQVDPIKPSATQQLLMQQSQQITVLQSVVMQQNQSNAKLQATNAQQATQIKQLQQMFMLANQQQAIEKSKEVNA